MALTKKLKPISTSPTSDQDIDGLLSGIAWASSNVTYSFPDKASDYGGSINGFRQFLPAQQTAVETILASIAAVAAITFSELSGDQDKDALIRYAGRKTADAYALYPSERADGGDAWFTTSGYYDNPLVGTGGYTGIMHETGHALGLKHSFENSVNGPVPANHDSLEYTVMSYSSYAGAKTWSAATTDFPQTLMMDDIAALQLMYGANFGTYSGPTTYTWSPRNGSLTITEGESEPTSFDAPSTDTIFMTIWDGGGEDEYDFGAFTSGLIIDLRPGEWVQTRDHTQTADLGATDKVAGAHYADGIVANGLMSTVPSQMGFSLIENATGGHGADIFIANQAVNKFNGGDGADFFTWSSFADGQNLLASVTGDDTIVGFTTGDKIDLRALDAHVALRANAHSYDLQVIEDNGSRQFTIHIEGNLNAADQSSWLLL